MDTSALGIITPVPWYMEPFALSTLIFYDTSAIVKRLQISILAFGTGKFTALTQKYVALTYGNLL